MTTTPQSMSDLPKVSDLYGPMSGEAEASMRSYCMTQLQAVEDEYPDTGKPIRAYLDFLANERLRLFEAASTLCRATAEQAGKVEGEDCEDCASMFEDALGYSAPCPKHRNAKPTQPAAPQPVPSGDVDWTGEDSVWKSGLYDRWNDYAKELGYTGICAALADIPRLSAAPVSPSREVEALVKDTIKREMAAWSDASQRDKDIARLALTSFSEKFDKAIGRLAPVQEKAP